MFTKDPLDDEPEISRPPTKQEYQKSQDYADWKSLEQRQNEQFEHSIAREKPFFDMLRMIATTAGLIGLVLVVSNSVESVYSKLVVVPLIMLALIASIGTGVAIWHWGELLKTQLALAIYAPFRPVLSYSSLVLHALIIVFQLSLIVSLGTLT